VIVVFDRSRSSTIAHDNKIVDVFHLTSQLVSEMIGSEPDDIDNGNVRVAVMSFSSDVTIDFDFNSNFTAAEWNSSLFDLRSELDIAQCPPGRTFPTYCVSFKATLGLLNLIWVIFLKCEKHHQSYRFHLR
jgi:hypothetical protein